MAESAAIGGWGTVDVLENKTFENVTGTAAERELKTQKIRKAAETAAKEKRLYAKAGAPRVMSGAFKIKKRPKYRHGTGFGHFDGFPAQLRRPRSHSHYAPRELMARGGQGGYRGSYGGGQGDGYGGGRGRGSYGNGGGPKGFRTCHRSVKGRNYLVTLLTCTCRCKSSGHLVANCPLPAPQPDK